MQGMQVWFLVRELRFHMPQGLQPSLQQKLQSLRVKTQHSQKKRREILLESGRQAV